MIVGGIRAKTIRFSFSPLQETLRALHVLSDPRHHAEQMDWVRKTRRRATPEIRYAIRRFRFLLDPPELFPERFPGRTATTFGDELQLLRAHPALFRDAMVRRMLGASLLRKEQVDAAGRPAALRRLVRETQRRYPRDAALLDAFAADSGATSDAFCDALETFFLRCLQPQWQQFEERVREDAATRRRLLERFGIAAMLRTLTPQLAVSGDRRVASIECGEENETIDLTEPSGISLTPSYFIWPHVTVVVLRRKSFDVRIAYPIASPSSMASTTTSARHAVAAKRFSALSDPTRLRILELLKLRRMSTRELAGLLATAESGVSRHLAILRAASLVDSARDGYFVLYRRAQEVDGVLGAIAKFD
ncbi:MAG TPA: DUF5937 family protein [Candidatus Tumulicola sp.]